MKIVRAAGDALELERARAFTEEQLPDRAWLHGALELAPLRERTELWQALEGERLLGLLGVQRGILPYTFVPLAARLPGVASALLERAPRPFATQVPARIASEVAAAGGQLVRVEELMVRFTHAPIPEPDPRVEALSDAAELSRFYGSRFSPVQLEFGPFYGARDAHGELASVGGVRFVTGRVAMLAHFETREDCRRQGLARAVVVALVRALESPGRWTALQVREGNVPARSLYASLGFRGGRRVWTYAFGAPGL